MYKSRLMMLVFLVWIFCVSFVLELFANVSVEKGDFLSLYVLCFDDFVQAGILSLTACTETLLLDFGLYTGMLVCFGDFLIFCCGLFLF